LATVREVVAANAFDRKVRDNAKAGTGSGGPILRKGRVGTSAEELGKPTWDQIAAVSSHFYDQAQTLALRDLTASD
jgi:hypothetical protein